MPRRGSRLTSFIWDALRDKKNAPSDRRNLYSNLDWVDEKNNIWCLVCLHMNNSECKKEHRRIFEDWHKLRPRKDDDIANMRQRLLVALKKCKNFKRLEERCTSTKHYYQFLNYDEIDGTYSFDPGPSLSSPKDHVQDLCSSSMCDAEGTNLDLSTPSLLNNHFFTEFSKLEQSKASNVCSHNTEAMNLDQGQVSPGVDCESGYGSGMEENTTTDSQLFDWFRSIPADQLDNMLNFSVVEPATIAIEEMADEQSLNGNQIKEISSTVEIKVPVDDFVDLLKRARNQSESGECITLAFPRDFLNRLQDASK